GGRIDAVRALLTALAHDSMQGRRTGTAGADRAARLIADEMIDIGLVAAGDGGNGGAADARRNAYLQRVPLMRARTAEGRERLTLRPDDADTVPAERRVDDANVIGLIPGSDATLRDEAIVVGAHYDHVGVGAPVNGDSIRNGADDDASGVVAVLEIARSLRQGPAPQRTIVFVAFTGEEMGGLGNRHYLAHPVVPLDRTVAELQIEMIGRPDSLAGGTGRAWLTGYDRSTMGDVLRDNGIPIVADPRPDQNFFRRSDNYAFALRGIPAHTLSSFNLHTDYHQPSDEVEDVDFRHMTAVIQAATRAVRILADGERIEWKPGGQPEPPRR
ncbi:MAG: M28 family metallopeptidase, partial [Longimicrobiales bacterium]